MIRNAGFHKALPRHVCGLGCTVVRVWILSQAACIHVPGLPPKSCTGQTSQAFLPHFPELHNRGKGLSTSRSRRED